MFDSHAHLQSSSFDGDREEVIKKMEEEGVGVINIGSNLEASQKGVILAKNKGFFAVVGLHPHYLRSSKDPDEPSFEGPETFKKEKYIPFLENEKVVGIGECGLDYFNLTDKSVKEKQKEVFKKQIDLAREYKKPLVLHIRSDKNNDAHYDAINILKEAGFNQESQRSGVAHFFTSDWEIASQFLSLGFYISFSGVITFTNQYDQVVKNVPLDKILVETDCPYVAPVPFRGKRNEPIFVEYVIKQVAKLKGLSFEEVAEETVKNTKKLFLNE